MPLSGNILSNAADLLLHTLVQLLLLFHIKTWQEIIHHKDHIDISRVQTQALRIGLGQLRRPAVAVAVGEQDIEIICLKLGLPQKVFHQLRHLVSEHRTDNADVFRLVSFVRVVDGLGDTDRLRLQFLCHIEAVAVAVK